MFSKTEEVRDKPVKEIMCKEFQTLHKDVDITEFLDKVEIQTHDVFPVVDDEENFLGDVHLRDLLKLGIDRENLNEHEIIGYLGTTVDESFFADTVEDIMNRHDVTVGPEERCGEVILLMWKEDLRAVPVVDGDGKTVGIVHEEDVITEIIDKIKEDRG